MTNKTKDEVIEELARAISNAAVRRNFSWGCGSELVYAQAAHDYFINQGYVHKDVVDGLVEGLESVTRDYPSLENHTAVHNTKCVLANYHKKTGGE